MLSPLLLAFSLPFTPSDRSSPLPLSIIHLAKSNGYFSDLILLSLPASDTVDHFFLLETHFLLPLSSGHRSYLILLSPPLPQLFCWLLLISPIYVSLNVFSVHTYSLNGHTPYLDIPSWPALYIQLPILHLHLSVSRHLKQTEFQFWTPSTPHISSGHNPAVLGNGNCNQTAWCRT